MSFDKRNIKIQKMLKERNQQDVELLQQHRENFTLRFQQVRKEPMSSDEKNTKIQKMLEERDRQDVESLHNLIFAR